MVFFSSLMLWLQPAGICPKFWSIPSLISPSARTIPDTVFVLIPHILVVSVSRSLCFESFSIMTFVEVFQADCTVTSFATPVGMVLDQALSVCICIIIIIIIIIIVVFIIIIIMSSRCNPQAAGVALFSHGASTR